MCRVDVVVKPQRCDWGQARIRPAGSPTGCSTSPPRPIFSRRLCSLPDRSISTVIGIRAAIEQVLARGELQQLERLVDRRRVRPSARSLAALPLADLVVGRASQQRNNARALLAPQQRVGRLHPVTLGWRRVEQVIARVVSGFTTRGPHHVAISTTHIPLDPIFSQSSISIRLRRLKVAQLDRHSCRPVGLAPPRYICRYEAGGSDGEGAGRQLRGGRADRRDALGRRRRRGRPCGRPAGRV